MAGADSARSSHSNVQKTEKNEDYSVKPGDLPSQSKETIPKHDQIVVRMSKLIQTTAGLGAVLATINFSANLATYLSVRSSTQSDLVYRFLWRTRSKRSPSVLTKALSISSILTPLSSLISDWRKTQRLTGLIPLYVRLKFLTSRKTLREMDPILHRLVLLQCNAYIVFQAIENICHLQGKGILPSSMIEKRGGMAKWIAWSCRAWCVGVVSDFFRLWREAEIEKKKRGRKTAQEQADFNRKWWNELMVAACWLPVAVHSSFYPKGIRGMNAGIVSLLSLIASLNSFRNQWRTTG
ncbi:uncharacterized protein A1O5_00987 [Cladophialophora psammophila CBS 110553]|uniref:Uncharacterized protein n=1 Tax=Cladophialophora psammophila CBS 110553 TaxID=1182543 RepID=W9Y1Z1_9EURO|nr:uncharacterized protein A1O5_00987 [Cladophialophora psammophila CBS 110553]EXJ76479.1 hypothetical protein A1O5_00987 [Cladophialophora psammophila CBS 110553]